MGFELCIHSRAVTSVTELNITLPLTQKGESPDDGTQKVGWRPPIFWKVVFWLGFISPCAEIFPLQGKTYPPFSFQTQFCIWPSWPCQECGNLPSLLAAHAQDSQAPAIFPNSGTVAGKEQSQSCVIGSWGCEGEEICVTPQSLCAPRQPHQAKPCLQLFLFAGLLLNQFCALYILFILVFRFALCW